MSIQYTAPGFKPTTFNTRVSSHNHQTRAPAMSPQIHIFSFFNLTFILDSVLHLTLFHPILFSLCLSILVFRSFSLFTCYESFYLYLPLYDFLYPSLDSLSVYFLTTLSLLLSLVDTQSREHSSQREGPLYSWSPV